MIFDNANLNFWVRLRHPVLDVICYANAFEALGNRLGSHHYRVTCDRGTLLMRATGCRHQASQPILTAGLLLVYLVLASISLLLSISIFIQNRAHRRVNP
jgi:hypothetical protein